MISKYHGITIWYVRILWYLVLYLVCLLCVILGVLSLSLCVFLLTNKGTILFKNEKQTGLLKTFKRKNSRVGPIKTVWDNVRWGKWPAVLQTEKEGIETNRTQRKFVNHHCRILGNRILYKVFYKVYASHLQICSTLRQRLSKNCKDTNLPTKKKRINK